jgi:hypothetical protein
MPTIFGLINLISDIKNKFVGHRHETIMYLQYLIPFFYVKIQISKKILNRILYRLSNWLN